MEQDEILLTSLKKYEITKITYQGTILKQGWFESCHPLKSLRLKNTSLVGPLSSEILQEKLQNLIELV